MSCPATCAAIGQPYPPPAVRDPGAWSPCLGELLACPSFPTLWSCLRPAAAARAGRKLMNDGHQDLQATDVTLSLVVVAAETRPPPLITLLLPKCQARARMDGSDVCFFPFCFGSLGRLPLRDMRGPELRWVVCPMSQPQDGNPECASLAATARWGSPTESLAWRGGQVGCGSLV